MRIDDILDQLDSRLSRMQAELPNNPDRRPLPTGWVEHFDPQRNVWYYIHLDASQPRATFIHPSDEGEESTNAEPTPPNRARPKSPISRRSVVAQQLYASSLGFGSKSLLSSTRESISNTTGSNSDPENSHGVAMLPVRTVTTRRDSASSTASSSHDPRKIFDFTRPAQGMRKYPLDESSPASASASTASTSPSSPSIHPAALPTVRSTAATHLSSINDTHTSQPIPPGAQAFYNPSVSISNPPPPSSSRPVLADRHNYRISVPISAGVSRNVNTELDQKRPQPIHITRRPSDDYKHYTAITQDETLKVAPNQNHIPYPPTTPGVTEDNVLVLPSHSTPVKRDGHLSPTINVADVQNPDTVPRAFPKVEKKLFRANSVPRIHLMKKSLTVDGSVVLKQPRPIRPLSGLPAHLNIQVAGLDSSEDARYYAESFQGKGKERRRYGFSAIFEAIDKFARRDSGIIVTET